MASQIIRRQFPLPHSTVGIWLSMPLQVYLTEMVALFINGFPRPAGRRKYLFCLLDEIGVQSLAERLSQEPHSSSSVSRSEDKGCTF